jgi:hypothetical protein
VDGYSSTASFVEIDLGSRALSAGTHSFRFTVTGRNAANTTAYWIALDYVRLVP